MTYYINVWNSGETDGTGVVFRTNSREQWLPRVKEIRRKYRITDDMCRCFRRNNLVFFSYYNTMNGKRGFEEHKFIQPPTESYGSEDMAP